MLWNEIRLSFRVDVSFSKFAWTRKELKEGGNKSSLMFVKAVDSQAVLLGECVRQLTGKHTNFYLGFK